MDSNSNKEKNALFVHDHKFRKIGKNFYSTGGLTDKTLERYTSVFGEMKIIGRVINETKTEEKYSQITNDKVKIINGVTLSNKEFISVIKSSSSIIVRLPSFFGLKAVRAAKKYNIPYLIELVGCPWDSLINHSLKGKLVAPYITFQTKKIVEDAQYVSYVTSEFLQQRYPTFGKSINCSNVSLNKFNDAIVKRRLNKIEEMDFNTKIIIGTIGAVNVKYKGQSQIFEVLSKLKKQGKINIEYHLVGGGNNNYLKSVAKKLDILDQVKFIGSVPHEKVNDWLDTIDLYIQPSLTEGLPRALIEAMSRGLPAIGSNVGGIPELLEDSFIYKSSGEYSTEIIDKLNLLTKDTLKKQAKRNFFESKNYGTEVIEVRRSRFLNDFKNNM